MNPFYFYSNLPLNVELDMKSTIRKKAGIKKKKKLKN